jgi:hypothetical protein
MAFYFWIFLYEYENSHFKSENFAFKFEIIIWFEPEISISNYYLDSQN